MNLKVFKLDDKEILEKALFTYEAELDDLEQALYRRGISKIEVEALNEKIYKHKKKIEMIKEELKDNIQKQYETYQFIHQDWFKNEE